MKSIKKSLITALIAAVVVFGAAGQAMADFAQSYLIRVVYDLTTGVEVATDLGLVTDLVGSSNTLVGAGDDAFGLSMFGEGASYSDLSVAYFTVSSSGSVTGAWLSSDESAPASRARGITTLVSGYNLVANYYATLVGTSNTVVSSMSAFNSYYSIMDASGLEMGSFDKYILTGREGSEADLAALETAGYVDQYLYYFTTSTSAQTGVQVATIRTWADGSTTINYNPVPVPPGILLLGGGLLGLLGLRRRIGLSEA